jgi:hypothetical protein
MVHHASTYNCNHKMPFAFNKLNVPVLLPIGTMHIVTIVKNSVWTRFCGRTCVVRHVDEGYWKSHSENFCKGQHNIKNL